jgi:hypothetical protein
MVVVCEQYGGGGRERIRDRIEKCFVSLLCSFSLLSDCCPIVMVRNGCQTERVQEALDGGRQRIKLEKGEEEIQPPPATLTFHAHQQFGRHTHHTPLITNCQQYTHDQHSIAQREECNAAVAVVSSASLTIHLLTFSSLSPALSAPLMNLALLCLAVFSLFHS